MKSVRTVENELLLKHIKKLTDKAWARIEHEAGLGRRINRTFAGWFVTGTEIEAANLRAPRWDVPGKVDRSLTLQDLSMHFELTRCRVDVDAE
jgi:hypothetical protein